MNSTQEVDNWIPVAMALSDKKLLETPFDRLSEKDKIFITHSGMPGAKHIFHRSLTVRYGARVQLMRIMFGPSEKVA